MWSRNLETVQTNYITNNNSAQTQSGTSWRFAEYLHNVVKPMQYTMGMQSGTSWRLYRRIIGCTYPHGLDRHVVMRIIRFFLGSTWSSRVSWGPPRPSRDQLRWLLMRRWRASWPSGHVFPENPQTRDPGNRIKLWPNVVTQPGNRTNQIYNE